MIPKRVCTLFAMDFDDPFLGWGGDIENMSMIDARIDGGAAFLEVFSAAGGMVLVSLLGLGGPLRFRKSG